MKTVLSSCMEGCCLWKCLVCGHENDESSVVCERCNRARDASDFVDEQAGAGDDISDFGGDELWDDDQGLM